jgi:cellulose synthase/poly-beta-1,6-N-acetylglucosamine synthase-like glycosyltransferase
MLIYLIFIFSIYFGFLAACLIGWRKFVNLHMLEGIPTREFVSLVVAMRNEEQSILNLLTSIASQDIHPGKFEIILVDDHSDDQTGKKIQEWMRDNPQVQCRYVSSKEQGKKQALTLGIKLARGSIILTTDADCILPPNWISVMTNSFSPETTMVIGLVRIQQDPSLFSSIQSLEFSSLIGSGVALLSLGFPVMCNGASLAFRKTSFDAVNGYEDNFHIPSGDDEFLMRKINIKFPGSIRPIYYSPEVVTTRAHTRLKDFINQRLRWAGKWSANNSLLAKGLAIFILLFQITVVIAFSLLIFSSHRLVAISLLGSKFLLEGYFLVKVNRSTSQRFSMIAFLILQGLYPFYVLFIGTFSQLLGYEWKGRINRS